MTLTPACLVLPGAGTALGVVAGAVEVLSLKFDWHAVGGTSGGGLVALARAAGFLPRRISALVQEMLMRDDLLDKGWPFDASPGLYRGERIQQILREMFGSMKMGDLKLHARVCAVDLATSEPCVFDSKVHADLEVWRVAFATMAIEFFFDPIRVRPDNARTYGDGGLALNVPAGLWDDLDPLPTVCVRFDRQHSALSLDRLIDNASGVANPEKVKVVRGWKDLVGAAFAVSMNVAATTLPCHKAADRYAEVVLRSDSDGMQFGLTRDDCVRRRHDGIISASHARFEHLAPPLVVSIGPGPLAPAESEDD